MKSLILLAGLLAATSSHAADTLGCHAVLMHPVPDDGSGGMWIPPEGDVVAFDYEPTEEKTVWLKIVRQVPEESGEPRQRHSQLGLEDSTESEGTIALEFSKSPPRGGKPYEGLFFGLFIREKSRWNAGPWIMSGGTATAITSPVAVTETMNGYVVVTCTKKDPN